MLRHAPVDDLGLHRALTGDAPLDAETLLPLLRALAARAPAQRGPWIGMLAPALTCADARVRAAAVMALGGACGRAGVAAIVRALDDGDPEVRAAATAASIATASVQPARIAHVVFHPRQDVRRGAYDAALPDAARPIAAHRLADPAFPHGLGALGLAPTQATIGLALELVRRGRVGADDVRDWIAEAPAVSLAAWADGAPWRASGEVARVLDSLGSERPGLDRLDTIFALFRADTPAAPRERLANAMRALVAGRPPPYGRRVAASLACACADGWAPELLALAAYDAPLVLAWPSIPLATKRAAATALYAYPKPRATTPPLMIQRMVESPLARRGGGLVDLRVAGAVARFQTTKPPYEWLTDVLGLDAVVRSFLHDPEDAAPFLSLEDASPKGRGWMVDRLLERAGADAPRVHAIAAVRGPVAELAALSRLPAAARAAIVERLLALEARPELAFDDARASAIASALLDGAGDEHALVARWLARADWEASRLGRALLSGAGRRLDASRWASALAALETKLLRRLLELVAREDGLVSHGIERALAEALGDHTSPAIAAWAEARTGPTAIPDDAARFATHESAALPDTLADAIALDPDPKRSVRGAAGMPWRGLVAALRRRTLPPSPSVDVAAALLGCHDEPALVAEELERWVEHRPAFLEALDAYALTVAVRHPSPPLLLRCWLWRFERYGLDAGRELIEGGLDASLRFATALPSPLLSEHVWATAARTLAVLARRERARLDDISPVAEAVLDLAIERLDHAEGLPAARVIRAIHEAGLAPSAITARRARIHDALPDAADEARHELRGLASADGLPSRVRGARASDGRASEDVLGALRRTTDLDELAQACRSEILAVVHEAALRLVALEEPGQRRLAWLLAEEPLPAHFDAITASLPLWRDGDALDAVRFALGRTYTSPELRFRVAIALAERGEDRLGEAVDAALAPGPLGWMHGRDAEDLVARADRAALRRLACAPHATLYPRAIRLLVAGARDEDDRAALRAFLALGSERTTSVRLDVAARLVTDGDPSGLPILASALIGGVAAEATASLFGEADEALVRGIVESYLVLGDRPDEASLVGWLTHCDPGVNEACLERLLAESQQLETRSRALSTLPRRPTRGRKLRALAELFGWGAAVSRALTGSVLRPHLISGDALGYTRLDERRVFVSPLPLLRGDRHGREIVEGLVLHEIGHHRHHKGPAARAVWAKADAIGLGRLLNLVADEHLERNLRAFDEDFGHRLKRLDAYAFQHADREIAVEALLDALGPSAFEVLTACALDAATHPAAVRVSTGSVLAELERRGSSFARFVRALRMGLGDRHDDPRVREALALFDRGFRKLDMRGLYAITKALHALFGDEVRLMGAFGGAESLEGDPWGEVTHGEEIDDADVQREVERILGPPDKSRDGGGRGGRGRLAIHVGPDEAFDKIHHVEKVPPDPVRHRALAAQVGRHARRLRQLLVALGLHFEPARMRLRGRRIDVTRLRPLVVRGDPRVLLARELRLSNDLFLGLVVDCSGSMAGPSMERAHAFGVLLTEAVRDLPGVDLRIFGFTDQTIFDAGDARRPAVTSLEATAGNNDAAGLYHAAQEALRSARKARLLVMISDGLPTECSVAALRALVRQLGRRHGIVCAQVAVRPLEEVCFPHYVEVDETNLDGAVARFGRIVARLIGRTLRGA